MYNQGEIVLVPFPYSDLTGNKKRPVLVISNNKYNITFNDIIVCVISSKIFSKDEYSLDLHNEDLEYGFLPEESIIKIHKIFTIDKNKIIKKFSKLKTDRFKDIQNIIYKLFEKSDIKSKL